MPEQSMVRVVTAKRDDLPAAVPGGAVSASSPRYDRPIAGHVFVSYSRADGAYMERLVSELGRRELDVWVDRNIEFGRKWRAEIDDRIRDCGAFVPIMSPTAEGSDYVALEVSSAVAAEKRILPLLLSGEVFATLEAYQFADVRAGELPPEAWFGRLRHDLADANTDRGLELLQDGRVEEAVAAYRFALQLEPGNRYSLLNLSSGLSALGQDNEALEILDELVRTDPTDAGAHLNRGNLLYKLGRLEEGLEAMGTSPELNPEQPLTYYNAAHLAASLGDNESALWLYERAIMLNPDDARRAPEPREPSELGGAARGCVGRVRARDRHPPGIGGRPQQPGRDPHRAGPRRACPRGIRPCAGAGPEARLGVLGPGTSPCIARPPGGGGPGSGPDPRARAD
jgi:tetratricopeptide (TPR) repeat protein